MTDKSIFDLADELGARVQYHHFISDRRSPLMSFEEWLEKRARLVPTNPQTYADIGKDI